MYLNKKKLRMMILEEYKRQTEMKEFAGSRSGQKFSKEGKKIMSAGLKIREIADDQTGRMRETLYNVSEFVEKLGTSLSNINELNEDGDSATESLPTVSELKSLIKAMKKLES